MSFTSLVPWVQHELKTMKAWENFLTLLETELGTETVQKWLRPLKIEKFDAANLYLTAADSFQVEWFEEHIRKKAKAFLINNNNRKIKVHISLQGDQQASTTKSRKKKGSESLRSQQPFSIFFDQLNPLCTLDNYIHTEAYPVPRKLMHQLTGYQDEIKTELGVFNPIYLWGASGSGKTHLLIATAHELQQQGYNVGYVHSDKFTEHVVTAMQAGEMSRFRQSYRNIDVLIIEDVQNFAKKWATQEELFHTFNTLHLAGKQIMLSACSPPSELAFIEARLISRFEWGIVLQVGCFQKEEIREILQTKTQALNYPLNGKVIDFFLETFVSGPKAICKALEALILRTHLNDIATRLSSTQLTVTLVQHQLADLIEEEKQAALNPTKVIQQVSEYFGIRPEDILGKGQSRDCVLPRQLAMYFCRMQLKIPFVKIGDLFHKDHSTVMSSVRQIQKGLDDKDETINDPYHAIAKRFQQSG